jgi:hypothetical protein
VPSRAFFLVLLKLVSQTDQITMLLSAQGKEWNATPPTNPHQAWGGEFLHHFRVPRTIFNFVWACLQITFSPNCQLCRLLCCRGWVERLFEDKVSRNGKLSNFKQTFGNTFPGIQLNPSSSLPYLKKLHKSISMPSLLSINWNKWLWCDYQSVDMDDAGWLVSWLQAGQGNTLRETDCSRILCVSRAKFQQQASW